MKVDSRCFTSMVFKTVFLMVLGLLKNAFGTSSDVEREVRKSGILILFQNKFYFYLSIEMGPLKDFNWSKEFQCLQRFENTNVSQFLHDNYTKNPREANSFCHFHLLMQTLNGSVLPNGLGYCS